jgi:hypothetical protein
MGSRRCVTMEFIRWVIVYTIIILITIWDCFGFTLYVIHALSTGTYNYKLYPYYWSLYKIQVLSRHVQWHYLYWVQLLNANVFFSCSLWKILLFIPYGIFQVWYLLCFQCNVPSHSSIFCQCQISWNHDF